MTLRLPLLALALAGAGATAVAQTTPAQTTPAQTTPTQTATGQTATGQTALGQTTAGQTTAGQTAPITTAQGTAATAAPNPTVGGAPMLATRTIVENAAAAPNLSTLVSAVKAAGLDTVLAGPGPFTVFAPTNAAFDRLAPGTLTTLMKPENKASLVKVLNYHVVAGKLTLAELEAMTKAGGGTATLNTVAGQPLTVTYANNVMTLTDPNGNKSYVQTPNVMQSNGVVHVVNGVLVPKLQ